MDALLPVLVLGAFVGALGLWFAWRDRRHADRSS